MTLLVELIWPILLLLTVSFIKQASKPSFKGPCKYYIYIFLNSTKNLTIFYFKTKVITNHLLYQVVILFHLHVVLFVHWIINVMILHVLKKHLLKISKVLIKNGLNVLKFSLI